MSDSALAKADELVERQVANGKIVERNILDEAEAAPFSGKRHELMAFPSAFVAAGATVIIAVTTLFYFRAEQLLIPDNIADSFDVLDLKVGHNSQFLSPNAMPGSFFRQSAEKPIPLKINVAAPSQSITLTVRNTFMSARRFSAMLAGSSIQ